MTESSVDVAGPPRTSGPSTFDKLLTVDRICTAIRHYQRSTRSPTITLHAAPLL